MLYQLQIENIGIIESLDMEFDPGLNVLTGETGAGKSIIISALNLVLGTRVKPEECLKSGAAKGTVSALFQLNNRDRAAQLLKNAGWPDPGDECLVFREITRDGKNRCQVNGRLASLTFLRELGRTLVDIHGTYDQQQLLQPESHLRFLDRFGAHERQLTVYREAYGAWSEKLREWETKRTQVATVAERQVALAAALQAFEGLDMELLEVDELERSHKRLNEAAHWRALTTELLELGTEGEASLLSRLRRFESRLAALCEVFPQLAEGSRELKSLVISLIDCCDQIRFLEGTLEVNADQLASLENTLHRVKSLCRQYQTDGSGLPMKYRQLKNEMESLQALPDLDLLEKETLALASDLGNRAAQLTRVRRKSSELLKTRLIRELSDLGMARATLETPLIPSAPTATGSDQMEFLLAANPGSAPKPLSRIASGGELCRIMLAFKALFAEVDEIPVLVFDEIDANIGGVTAVAAGEKMQAIARHRQVLTVTHQPQIASKAGRHFAVTKTHESKDTHTGVRVLEGQDRVDEIARMLGGARITSVVTTHAREMLQESGNA